MDKLITCPVCESDFCYEVEQEQKKLWHCFGCGFASNSNQHIETVDLEKNYYLYCRNQIKNQNLQI